MALVGALYSLRSFRRRLPWALVIMRTIPGFWVDGPHDPIPVEASWREFVTTIAGTVLEDALPKQRNFENADFAFFGASVVVELKELETEFSSSPKFQAGFDSLMQRLIAEDPDWRPSLFGGLGKLPKWFTPEFVRLFRTPLSRVLKKANRQIRETKNHFEIQVPTGIFLLANDGFTAIGPDLIRAQISELLTHSYSSIDCFVYLTVNRYVEIAGSDQPRLLWVPTYSDRASDDLVAFVDNLGHQWFDYLESKVGPFTSRVQVPHPTDILRGAQSIEVPPQNDG